MTLSAIGILAPEADVHARAVAREVSRLGGDSVILDTRRPHEQSWQWRVGKPPTIRTYGGVTLSVMELGAIWIRRAYGARPPDFVRHPDDRAFARNEWGHLLDAVLADTPAELVNRPSADLGATKPRQLEAARRSGLPVPDTLISNDPAQVVEFVAGHHGKVIHKALSSPQHLMIDTRRWDPRDARLLDTLPLAPVIFQEEITGAFDIRANVIGDRILAARFATADSPVDTRLDLGAPCETYELPAGTHEALLRFMKELGLDFGAVDLKVDDEGRHVFLEVNPSGQFLFVEVLTGLPISEAVARFLTSTSRDTSQAESGENTSTAAPAPARVALRDEQ
ncbi:RimK family alpha-L-glutamate ligase [Streptomyces sp. NPDC015130]|uniref:ATP-grasp domain-containing protein n=1 Tax=Streptomyces sp. NPDC015130 TaxID=3364940 RepID=UPI0036FFE5A1